jgi:hypothetical protein
MKVITYSRQFPATHPRKGQPTGFVEKIWKSLYINGQCPDELDSYIDDYPFAYDSYNQIHKKVHTIRSGHRWKVGDWFSPRVWSGKPYASKQIQFAPPIQIKKIWDIEIHFKVHWWLFKLNGQDVTTIVDFNIDDFVPELAKNDGLSLPDFLNWFEGPNEKKHNTFKGQILCWNESLNYLPHSPFTVVDQTTM